MRVRVYVCRSAVLVLQVSTLFRNKGRDRDGEYRANYEAPRVHIPMCRKEPKEGHEPKRANSVRARGGRYEERTGATAPRRTAPDRLELGASWAHRPRRTEQRQYDQVTTNRAAGAGEITRTIDDDATPTSSSSSRHADGPSDRLRLHTSTDRVAGHKALLMVMESDRDETSLNVCTYNGRVRCSCYRTVVPRWCGNGRA